MAVVSRNPCQTPRWNCPYSGSANESSVPQTSRSASRPGADVCRRGFTLSTTPISDRHCGHSACSSPHDAHRSGRTRVGTRVASSTRRARLIPTNLSNLRPSLTRSVANRLGAGTSAGLPSNSFGRTTMIMEHFPLSLVEGTAALKPANHLETEFVKDRWDARNIPGLRYGPHGTQYYINFLPVPALFRPLAKSYARFKFAEGRAASTLIRSVYCVGNFLTFFLQCYPQSMTLQALSVQAINAFIVVLKSDTEARKLRDAYQHLSSTCLYRHYTRVIKGIFSKANCQAHC